MIVWTPRARALVSPRRWPDEPRDASITPEACVREIEQLVRRWDEASEAYKPLGTRWEKLRLTLARCEDAVYGAARDAAARDGLPAGLRCALAWAFPHETARSHALGEEIVAAPPRCAVALLSSIADADLATRLALPLAPYMPSKAAFPHDFVVSMQEAAARPLLALLDSDHRPRSTTAIFGALMVIHDDVVARWFAAHLDRTVSRRAAAAYFREAPELRGHLKEKTGRTAKTLMTMTRAAEVTGDLASDEEVPAVLRRPPWRPKAEWPPGLVYKDEVALQIVSGTPEQRARWVTRLPWLPPAQVASSGAAFAVAHAYCERDDVRDDAHAWLLDLAEIAATGLVPMAIGKDARRRTAGRVLRLLVAEGQGAAVEAGIARYAPDVAAVARAVLTADAHFDVPINAPKLPPVLGIEGLEPPSLRSGKRLPNDAAVALAELMALTSDGLPYVGCDDVRAACTPESLERFSWALCEAWDAAGAPTKSRWPITALATFGGDFVARELGPRLRGWAQKHQVERALDGVSVLGKLARRGSDVALVQLMLTGEVPRPLDLGVHAGNEIAGVAGLRHVAVEALSDELDASPDNKADVDALQRLQVHRLERALRSQRGWPVSALTTLLQRDVMRGLVMSLVWRTGATTFRVTEDGLLADSSDRRVDITGTVFIAHPIQLEPSEIARWSTVLADYEIVQPFPQLGREVFKPTDEERKSATCSRFAGKTVTPGALFGLETRGWKRRGESYVMQLNPTAYASFALTPGSGGPWGPQQMGPLELKDTPSGVRCRVFAEVDPVTCSEIFRDLASL